MLGHHPVHGVGEDDVGLTRCEAGFDQLLEQSTRIDLAALRANLGVLRAAVAPAQVMGVVKAQAYGHGAVGVARALAADPRNDLFWRFDMRRLTSEEIRDTILAANGTLNLAMYGPGVFPPIPRDVMVGQSRPGEGWGHGRVKGAALFTPWGPSLRWDDVH